MYSLTKSEAINKILLFIILLNIISFIHIKIFTYYDAISFYFNLVVLVLILLIRNKFNIEDRQMILYLLLLLSYCFFTLFFTGGGFGSVVVVAYSLIVFWIFRISHFDNKSINTLIFLMFFTNIFFVIKSPGYYEKFLFNKEQFINSNTVGMVLFYSVIYFSIFLRHLYSKKYNILLLVMYILNAWAIMNCKSRGSFIGLMVFLFLDIFTPKIIWQRKNLVTFITFSTIIMGLLFTYILSHNFFPNINYLNTFMDKPLYTGREVIWSNIYSEISNNKVSLLLGLGSKLNLNSGVKLQLHNNLHNNYLHILTDFGLFGFIMYFGFWIYQIRKIYNKYKYLSYTQIRFLLLFLSILFLGFVETSMLWENMFLLCYMSLGFAQNDVFKK